MKTIITFIIVLFVYASQAQGDSTQRDSQYKYGLQFGTSMLVEGTTLLINPLITHSNDKHQFGIGPKFFTGVWIQKGLRFGVEANYRYYPNSKVTPFSSFLLVNTELYYMRATSSYTDNWSIPNESHEVTRETLSRTAIMHLGYGIEWRFVHQFYLSTDISAGGLYQVGNTKRTSEEPSLNAESVYGGFGLSARVGVSLGWRFR